MFLLIFIVGGFAIAYNVRNTLRSARSSDLSTEKQALTSANPGSDQWLRAVRASRGRIVPVGPNRAAGAALPQVRARGGGEATGEATGEAAENWSTSTRPKSTKPKETGATGKATKSKS